MSVLVFAQDCKAFRPEKHKSFYVGNMTVHLLEIMTKNKTITNNRKARINIAAACHDKAKCTLGGQGKI